VITDVNDKEDDAQHDDSLQAEEKQISASAVQETGFSARCSVMIGTKGIHGLRGDPLQRVDLGIAFGGLDRQLAREL
jgi:hypothetical protein